MRRYAEGDLIRRLDRIDAGRKVAFAAACAERLAPAYQAWAQQSHSGQPLKVADYLNSVWQALLGRNIDSDELASGRAHCESLVPGDAEPWLESQAYADDAVSAVAYALGALASGLSQEAAWAARRAYEALDRFVSDNLGIEDEVEIVGHRLVQAELERQERDLTELESAAGATSEFVAKVRDRARAEAGIFFRGL